MQCASLHLPAISAIQHQKISTKNATFNQYILLMNIYFIKIHAIKTIVITQPLVLWLLKFLIEYLLFSDALKDKDDYPWMRCLTEDRFEEISKNGSLMLNKDYMMDMFSSIASKLIHLQIPLEFMFTGNREMWLSFFHIALYSYWHKNMFDMHLIHCINQSKVKSQHSLRIVFVIFHKWVIIFGCFLTFEHSCTTMTDNNNNNNNNENDNKYFDPLFTFFFSLN